MLIVPSAYQTLMARAVAGEAIVLLPTNARVGTGNNPAGVLGNPLPSDVNIQTPVITGIAITVSRVGRSIKINFTVAPTGTAYQITEMGIFTAAGVPVMLETFRPRTLPVSGASLNFERTLFPEV